MEYPESVAATLEKLRTESNNKVTLSMIRGRFCAYEYKYIVDADRKSNRIKRQFYIGWIDNLGEFHKAVHRTEKTRAKNINEYIERGLRSGREYESAHVDDVDSLILESLSRDARMPVPIIASNAGISTGSAYYRIKSLFKKYDIRKTIEIYPKIFGFYRFIAVVKFFSKQPDYSNIKSLLAAEPLIQMAAIMKGDHDLLIYMLAENVDEVEKIIYRIRSNRFFSGISSSWEVGYLREWHGYIPLRDEFFKLLESRVWKKSRDSPRREKDQLLPSEYAVLRELNSEGGMEFTAIDEKHRLSRGNAQHTYRKLIENKVIERATIVATKPNCRFSLLIYLKQFDVVSFNQDRLKYITYVRDDAGNSPFNRFTIAGDASAPYGEILLTPVFGYSQEDADLWIRRNVRGVEIGSSIITDYLVGCPGFRRLADIKNEAQDK